MTAPYVEMDPEAILIHERLDGSELGDQALRADASLWHLIDVERGQTWCGIDLGYGIERLPWSQTPTDRRCETCLGRFERIVVRS